MKSVRRQQLWGQDYFSSLIFILPLMTLSLLLSTYSSARATTYYVSNSGSDSNSGTSQSSPWQTIAKVQNEMSAGLFRPGDSILFQAGGTWYEQLSIPSGVNGTSGSPITLGSYGSGAKPVIDGQSSRAACISAVYVGASYIVVNGFECRNTTQYGINFNDGSADPGIVIENNYVHNTGPGACAGCGGAYDDGNYRNQINFEIDNSGTGQASGVRILNNTVENSGGHNSIEVHHDEGSPIVRGNTVINCGPHGCIDLKSVIGAVVDSNSVTNPNGQTNAPCIYTENEYVAQETITVERNYCYQTPVGIQAEYAGFCDAGSCALTEYIYNNTIYESASIASLIDSSCDAAPMSFTVKNNIIDGGYVDYHSSCQITWDYNDDGGSQGLSSFSAPNTPGPHDLNNANPQYAADPVSSLTGLESGLLSTSPCLYAGTNVGLPYNGPAPTIGAWNPPSSTPTPTPIPPSS
jgi:hypothetical protein